MKCVLIAEDEAELAYVLQHELMSNGYRVKTAPDGQGAMAICQASPPDLVITDIYMPRRDGLELIRDLRQKFPTIKIIAMSGNSTAPTFLKIADYFGADRTLFKPFLPPEMLQAVEELLN